MSFLDMAKENIEDP